MAMATGMVANVDKVANATKDDDMTEEGENFVAEEEGEKDMEFDKRGR
jgi:hypothetical protein